MIGGQGGSRFVADRRPLWAGVASVRTIAVLDSAELLFGFKGAEMRRFVRTALNCLGGQLTSKLKVAGSNPAGVATSFSPRVMSNA